MPTLLRLDASFRTDGSVSRAVADSAEQAWHNEHPDGTVVHRELGTEPLPATAWAAAVGGKYTPVEHRTPEQLSAIALAATLAGEIIDADAVILASPLYNFGISQYTKTWIDLLISDDRLGPGTEALKGKRAVLVVSQGGGYRAGTPREGWDHATPYLERIFRDNFGMDVQTVVVDLTLASVNPAMSHLIESAEQALTEAHTSARTHGAGLAQAA